MRMRCTVDDVDGAPHGNADAFSPAQMRTKVLVVKGVTCASPDHASSVPVRALDQYELDEEQ